MTRTPPRLRGFDYRGIQRYFVTIATKDRRRVFLDGNLVEEILAHLRQHAAAERFSLLAYCFMPDHLHILVEGGDLQANLQRFVARFKQTSAHAFGCRAGGQLWQSGYYDRVLRDDEHSSRVARYIVGNPIRAGLCGQVADYPYTGSDVYPLEELAMSQASADEWSPGRSDRSET